MTKRIKKARASKRNTKPAEKPVSLAPLSFEEALKAIAEIKPAKAKPSA